MQELQKSPAHYSVKKDSKLIRITADAPIRAVDTVYDQQRKRYVLAVETEDNRLSCVTDYLILSSGFELLEALREDAGSLPSFLTAPDGSIWAELISNGSILPLEKRTRITEPVADKDRFSRFTPFLLNGQSCKYRCSYIGSEQCDELLVYLFDSDSLFTKKQRYTLDGLRNAHPTVFNGKCYLTYGVWDDCICTAHIAELRADGTVTLLWKSEPFEQANSVFLLTAPDEQIRLLTYCDNHVNELICGANGRILSRSAVHDTETPINLLYAQQVCDGTAAVRCASLNEKLQEKDDLLYYDGNDGLLHVYPQHGTRIPALLDSSHILLSNSRLRDDTNCDILIRPILFAEK